MRVLILFGLILSAGCSATPSSGDNPRPTDAVQNDKDRPKPDKGPTDKDKGPLPPPCHPGCFPAGTPVATPDGLRKIESIGVGETVTVVTPGGAALRSQVSGTFTTCTRLVEVLTDAGKLRTTATQPLCLQSGGFRTAGDLVAGDSIWRWIDGTRQAVRVRAIVPLEGEAAAVYNLVVGADAVFVADGFLARGKPVP